MKAAALVIVLPLLSVLILSLYGMGGTARWAALALLAGSMLVVLVSFMRKRNPGIGRK